MHFVSIIFSCSYSLSSHREIKQNEDRGTTKEYVCLHTMEIFPYCKQLTNDRQTDHRQLLIIHLVLQDEQAEKQILFLLQIMAWGEITKHQFQMSNKRQLNKIKKGKTSMLGWRNTFFKE